MKQHVAIFIPSLRIGGVQRAMLNLAEGLLRRGVDVDFVLVRAEGSFMNQVPTGVRIFDLKSNRVLSSLPSLIRYLKENRPNALLSAQTHVNILALWARFLAKSFTKIVISERNNLTAVARNAAQIKECFRPIVARLFYSRADRIVAVSHGVAEDLAKVTKLPIESIQVIYNPVNTPELYLKAEVTLGHPWFVPDAPPVLLSVGRLAPQKDYQTFILAFDQLRMKLNIRLMILGEGPQRVFLQKLTRELGIDELTAFPGIVENPFSYMSRAAVFVLSSAWEGFGNVLVEAMACGTPVVSTDCPSGPSELLQGGKYGPLVPVGDPEALAKAIEAVLESPLPGSVLQKRAEDFSVDKITDQYLQLLMT